MCGTTPGDEEAVRIFQNILEDVAPGWRLRGFKGDLLAIAVLEKDNTQVEVGLWGVPSGRAVLEWARGDSQKANELGRWGGA